MDDRLEGPDKKLERAERHIEELQAESVSFLGGDGYAVVADLQTEPGRRLDRVRVTKSVSPELACILGDVLHNLRASLELLAYQAVEAGGMEGKPDRDTGFPICQSADDLEASGLRKVEGAGKAAIDLIRAARPYRGGNDSLWKLHHLDRYDKHRLLTVVGAGQQHVSLDFVSDLLRENPKWRDLTLPIDEMRIAIRPADTMFPLKDGDVLYSADVGQDHDPQHSLFIAFGQGEIVEGEPILESVREMADSVKGVLEGFRRIL